MALRNSDDEPLHTGSRVSAEHDATVASIISSTRSMRPVARILPDGYSFGRYHVVRLIAIGGMSEVYEAVHNGLEKRVALKVLRPDLAQSVEARERFVSEGVNAARIRHTNVVDVTDVGIVDELPYLVMSLLEGEDLGMLYERHGRLPICDLVDLLLPVACAVAVGHSHGIVHRDLKPDNIFLHREGCRLIPKVLDFGVSRAMNARRITPNARVFGTPHYMSPEQARGAATDARTDQYALGVILYEGVTGRLPRDSENPLELLHAVAFDSFQLPSTHIELPDELERVIIRAMSHEPEARFASMIEFALALLPFASEPSREYWSLELNSLPANAPTPAALLSIARPPSHAPESPLLAPARASQPGSHVVMHVEPSPVVQSLTMAREPHRARDSLQPQIAIALPRPGRRQRSLFWLGTAAGAVLALGGAWLTGHSQRTPRPVAATAQLAAAQYDVDVHVLPPTAAVLLDGQQVAVGHYRARLARDGKLHELRANAAGFITRSHNFRDEAPPRDIQLTPNSAVPNASTVEAELATIAEPLHAVSGRASTGQPRVRSGSRGAGRDAPRRQEIATSGPHIVVIGSERPRVRIVDEFEPHVRIIE
jgi:serine/threonine protein kinase